MNIQTDYDKIFVTNPNSGLTTVTNIDGGGAEFELSNCKFAGGSLQTISNITITNVTGTSLFNNCKSLESVEVNLPNCISANTMFAGCSKVTGITATMPKLTNANNLFSQCTSLKRLVLDIRKWGNGTNLQRLLQGNSTVEYVELIIPSTMLQYAYGMKQYMSEAPAAKGYSYEYEVEGGFLRYIMSWDPLEPVDYDWEDYVFSLAIANPNVEQIGSFINATFDDNDATMHVTVNDFVDKNRFKFAYLDDDPSLSAINSWTLALNDSLCFEGMNIYIVAGDKPVTFGDPEHGEETFANQETQWEYSRDWWVRIA